MTFTVHGIKYDFATSDAARTWIDKIIIFSEFLKDQEEFKKMRQFISDFCEARLEAFPIE